MAAPAIAPAGNPPHPAPVPWSRPLIGIVLVFMAGTGCGLAYLLSPLAAVCAASGALLLAMFAGRRSNRSTARVWTLLAAVLLYSAVFFAAWAWCVVHPAVPAANLRAASDGAGTHVVLLGVVADDARQTACAWEGRCLRTFRLRAEWMRLPGETAWRRTRGTVRVRGFDWINDRPGPRYGERWCTAGQLYADPYSSGRYGSLRPLLEARSFAYSGDRQKWSLRAWCHAEGRRAAGRLAIGIEDYPQTVAILQALLLGSRSSLSPSMKNAFVETGTFHVFAISGLHVGIICGLIVGVLRLCGVARTRWIFFLGPLLVAYTMGTGMRASAVRACAMAIVFFLGPALGRRPDWPAALATAALVILVWDPTQLAGIGFIFSFAVVTGLMVLCPILERPLRRLWQGDPLQSDPVPAVVRGGRRLLRGILSLAVLSVCAWLVSAPLMAHYFGRLAPIALLSNMLVIPLVFLTVTAGCLSLVLGSCLSLLADIFNHANLALVWVLVRVVGWLRTVPGGTMDVAEPPVWGVLLWFLALGTLVVGIGKGKSLDSDMPR